ncbi:hypothetical protein GCM10018785_51850 [Streptomyces longispororuber]|uniref:DUF1707 domain-containing protein n=1 Tax=Streptomyces longispororuber TaxID=68230 RepID=A0A919DSW6_9ACTN|nr:DUF1707 domain-containing protein [Streptomyces longispororuber]GHE77249.1 hypothetical protein GCM10018785_51850 [Streptomyces longispororuber]
MDLQKRSPAPSAAAPPRLRASDADRDRAAEILTEGLATGRLDPQEHTERLDGVYRAKTLAEIEPYVADLPAPGAKPPGPGPAPDGPAPGAVPEAAGRTLYAVLGDTARRGRWRPARRTHAYALFGDVVVDLSEAEFEHRQILVRGVALFGEVRVRVPENVSLRGHGTAVLGTFDVDTLESAERDAPVVFVSGMAVCGSVTARPKRGKRIRDLRARLRRRLEG